jgi:hypothetical protein
MVGFLQFHHLQKVATLDQDATLMETTKRDALFNYKGFFVGAFSLLRSEVWGVDEHTRAAFTSALSFVQIFSWVS